MKGHLLLFFLFGLTFSVFAKLDTYRELGSFSSPFSAFTHVDESQGEDALFITSFGANVAGSIHYVPQIAKKLSNIGDITPSLIATDIVWPNEVENVPEEVFGPNFIISCGGFLVPGYRTGKVIVIDVLTGQKYDISETEQGYFYHLGVWYDVNGDGKLDVVSAKTNLPVGSNPDGKLVWYENPGTFTFPWVERVLVKGPDVFFRIQDINGDGKDEIIASIFFNGKVSVFYNNNGTFSDPNSWNERLVTNTIGSPFDVRVADVNKDGKVDLLVTNHQNLVEESAVFVFEIPDNLETGDFIQHTIATGFETTQPGEGQASPGSAQAFYSNVNETNKKPLIMVSGDGTQRAHLLRPTSEDPSNWIYQMETILFVNATVGGIAIGDVDKDGYTEFFIPNYDDGEIHIFTFSP